MDAGQWIPELDCLLTSLIFLMVVDLYQMVDLCADTL